MGILADLFVATPAEATAYEASLLQSSPGIEVQYDPKQFRNVTDINFSILYALVEDEPWNLEKHRLKLIHLGDDGESWLFELPRELCEKLAKLSDQELDDLTTAWAATEEFVIAQWTASDVAPLTEALRELSKRAIESERGLYLWGSL
ncbi:MAG: hypothetical protein AAGL69_05955 [Pseudomonadota bacterium]